MHKTALTLCNGLSCNVGIWTSRSLGDYASRLRRKILNRSIK